MYPFRSYSESELQIPRTMERREKRARRIFYLKEEQGVDWYLQSLRKFGCKSYRYLKHIGAIVGEFPQDTHTQFDFRKKGFLHSETDIQVTIGVPHMGRVMQTAGRIPWGIERIEANRAWPLSMGRKIKVAVIDTGIAYDHPAIHRNYRGGVNVLSPLFSPYDYNGHGTHVSGTIAGRKNETGVVGVAPRAHLYAVKAFNRKGSANLSDLLTAINWCIDHRMQVVNMSFGMDKMSESLKRAIHKAHSHGIVMVAAAGNEGKSGKLDYPARYKETIAVTATGKNDELAPFSNTGKGVHLAAPGDKITSAWINGGTRELSGTSMAVPHVVGTSALLLEMNPDLTSEDIMAIMGQASRPLGHISGGRLGMINAYRSARILSH